MRSTLEKALQALQKPTDPSLLALFRICFGICMMVDIPQERGMGRADSVYGKDNDGSMYCTFPLIHGLEPFSVDVMICLYAVMFLNAFFVTVGYFYRFNTVSFAIIYWYFFVLDTSNWNNHSYLYGLIAILFCVTDANKFMSVDNFLQSDKEKNIPQWNYFIFQFQVFLVYFYAGLKKTEADWLTGYSMQKLSREWVFDPFRFLLTNEQIDFWIVHIGGFLFDISVGFLLMFPKSRLFGLFLCLNFHGMNAMMFNIGMFPYVMLASSFIFCDPSSFRNVLSKIPMSNIQSPQTSDKVAEQSKHSKFSPNGKWGRILSTLFCAVWVTTQAFLPYSHFITKGYNGWTNGLYGYSWDMMVHSFSNQHVRISYKNLNNGDIGYLKPGVFLAGRRSRWTTQPAMAFQYAKCIKKKLRNFGVENAAVYFDVWKSMNNRFQQRIFDPDVDIANYPWTPFQKPSFVLPLLANLSDWREELQKIKSDLRNVTKDYKIVFVADFYGMHLDNYVSGDIGNVTLTVLQGRIRLEGGGVDVSLDPGMKYDITTGEFHRVYTTSKHPSCFYYIYMNTTRKSIKDQFDEYEHWLKEREKVGQDIDISDVSEPEIDPELVKLFEDEQKYQQAVQNMTYWHKLSISFSKKIHIFRKSFALFYFSVSNLSGGHISGEQSLAFDEDYIQQTSPDEADNFQTNSGDEPRTEKTEL